MVNTPQDKAFVVRTEQRDLCDPGTFLPIKVYYGYAENDTLLTLTANNADGTEYTGDISLLVTCGAGGGGGGTNVNASQAGSWTVNVVQPVTVDGTVAISGTVPVSAASLPLPSGAATAANQLADGHNVTTMSRGLALRLDEGATYTYIGEAVPGTSEAAASWRIKRMTNADTTIVWAAGTAAFTQVWNNRAALVYS